jgi:hypothetical protein
MSSGFSGNGRGELERCVCSSNNTSILMPLEGREGIKGSDWCLVVPEVEESGSRSALDIHGRLGRLMLDAEGGGKRRGDERMREWRELLVGWQSVLPLRYMSIIFLHHHLSSSLAHPTISCTHAYSRRQNTTEPTDRQTDRQTDSSFSLTPF